MLLRADEIEPMVPLLALRSRGLRSRCFGSGGWERRGLVLSVKGGFDARMGLVSITGSPVQLPKLAWLLVVMEGEEGFADAGISSCGLSIGRGGWVRSA